MKVWELIAKLSEFKANAEVTVSTQHTSCTGINEIDKVDDDNINLVGGDSYAIMDDGSDGDWLSDIVKVEE